jgi:hypothetical protein
MAIINISQSKKKEESVVPTVTPEAPVASVGESSENPSETK